MAFILIVEDEVAIGELVAIHARIAGHKASILHNGNEVMGFIEKTRPDLIVLDVMLPGQDGFSLMPQIAPTGIPVIFLTAKDRLDDRILGLKLGADDYVVKPFAVTELAMRIETVLRRCKANAKTFALGSLEVNFDERAVTLDGLAVELTAREFELLKILIDNRNIALSRDKLLELAWGFDYMGETRTVDVHIQRLRKKLNMESIIKTVYKLGYRLEAPR
ncbi:MAG: response regulator transcription factor [Clostridiales bacterium]|jgi:DNA-binding response OmpR family regulator|nr:response regulator transcription factor [Clostridiales bacterium]